MNQRHTFVFVFALCALSIGLRLVPMQYNFQAMGALALFSGCFLLGRLAWTIPLAAMAISDVLGFWLQIPSMGFYNVATMLCVYGGFLVAFAIGRLVRTKTNLVTISAGAIGSACAFFLISNFGSWLDPLLGYEKSLSGLMNCYIAAIPFCRATFTSDLVFAGIFFGSYQVIMSALAARSPEFAAARVRRS